MAGFEDAAIDASTKVLDKGAEQAGMCGADGEIAMQANVNVTHERPLRLTGHREKARSS